MVVDSVEDAFREVHVLREVTRATTGEQRALKKQRVPSLVASTARCSAAAVRSAGAPASPEATAPLSTRLRST